MPWAARESEGTTTTNTSSLLSVGKEHMSGTAATPRTASQDRRTETRIDGLVVERAINLIAQRVPTLGAGSQTTASFQLEVLVDHRPRRPLRRHVEHQDAGATHVTHRLLPSAQQFLGSGLTKRVARVRRPQRRDRVE